MTVEHDAGEGRGDRRGPAGQHLGAAPEAGNAAGPAQLDLQPLRGVEDALEGAGHRVRVGARELLGAQRIRPQAAVDVDRLPVVETWALLPHPKCRPDTQLVLEV